MSYAMGMFDPTTSDSQHIFRQAAEWLARMLSGAWTPKDQRDLEQWLRKDVRHREAFGRASGMWLDMDGMAQGMGSIRAAAMGYRPRRGFAAVNRAALALAASLLAAVGLMQWYWFGTETSYLTAKGEQKPVVLADGSSILLNTDTELHVRIAAGRRVVSLARGEALFNVAHDAWRPFVVEAGVGRVRDLGTRFSVYARQDRVTVNVLEGKVEVSSARAQRSSLLSAGQAAAYDGKGALLEDYRADVDAATAWRDGALVFQDLPLSQALEQLSRYHPVSFELADRRLGDIKISGSFQASNLALFLKTLQAGFPVKTIALDAGRIRLESRAR